MARSDTLHLIKMYNRFTNRKPPCDVNDIFLYLYGFFGEQMKIETQGDLIDNFAREKYILEVVSQKDENYRINISKIIKDETGYSENLYSAILILIWSYCKSGDYIINNKGIPLKDSYPFTNKDILNVIDRYSVTLEEIKSSSIKRQVFYSKPFIKLTTSYVATSSFLILSMFANSNYWVVRDYYKYSRKKSEHFIRAFGTYFELYVKEIFENCLSPNEYSRIPEGRRKRADWILNLFGRDILIEQKSTISEIRIKQNYSDVDAFKNYIERTWYKAAKQLNETENDLQLKQPIKIILLYEDYFKSESLEEIYRLHSDLMDDRRLWLITIEELELFMMLYHDSPEKAQKVFEAKNNDEKTNDKKGRELLKYLTDEGVTYNYYLQNYGIYAQINKVLKLLGEKEVGNSFVGGQNTVSKH